LDWPHLQCRFVTVGASSDEAMTILMSYEIGDLMHQAQCYPRLQDTDRVPHEPGTLVYLHVHNPNLRFLVPRIKSAFDVIGSRGPMVRLI
jgi:hypothetical protein